MRKSLKRKNVKKLLSLIGNRQFFTFLPFLVISSAFWLFTVLSEVSERTFSLPLRLHGVPTNVVLTTPPPSEIRFTLRDRGFVLLTYEYSHRFDTLHLNWDHLVGDLNSFTLTSAELSKTISSRLEHSTRLLSFSPSKLQVTFNYGQSKRLPVVVQGTIEPDSAYAIIARETEPRNVLVYAAPQVLDTLNLARLKAVHLRGLHDTIERSVPFAPIPGVKFVPSSVKLRVYADRLVPKTAEVRIQGVNFPADKRLLAFPPKVTISYQVGFHQQREVKPSQFVLVVNYEDLINDTDNRLQLKLKSIPLGVRHCRIIPSEVEYLIEQNPNP